VFKRIDAAAAAAWRERVATLAAAVDLQVLALLDTEVAAAAEAFSVKYFDILQRRRVLYGTDPFANVTISREALERRVRQVLLNLTLQLRHSWLLHNETGQTHALVDAIGPLRAAALAYGELRGLPRMAPKEALEAVAAEKGVSALLERIQTLRQRGDPAAQDAANLLGELIEFVRQFSESAAASRA
jgi:hypothetical protein